MKTSSAFPSPSARACIALGAALLVGLAGCNQVDPYTRPGVWRPLGVNEANIAMQLAHPGDLVRGRGTDITDSDTATQAVDRLRHDKVKKLPDSSISSIGASGGG